MLSVLLVLLPLLVLAPDDPKDPKKAQGPKKAEKAEKPKELSEAGKLLRTAWASQYEWTEDEVESVALSFTYSSRWRGRDEAKSAWKGRGELLIVGGKLLRVHMPGSQEWQRKTITGELHWVLARFMRKPFAEVFKGQKFKGPEKLARDILRVTAGRRVFLLKDDRIVGSEQWRGPPKKPQRVRIDYSPGPLGGGYGILGTAESYTIDSKKTRATRTLTIREGERAPAPLKYVSSTSSFGGESTTTIEFEAPEFDQKDAVLLDPSARDILKAAWEARFTLAADLRLEGRFERESGKGTRLRRKVEGEFQVWGMDKIDAVLDERGQKLGNAEQVRETCRAHLIGGFDVVRAIAFDKEFENCGFRLEDGVKEQVVTLIGHPSRLAFRLKDTAIVGHTVIERPETWFRYKIKRGRDGFIRIRRIDVEIDDNKHRLDFRYGKSRSVEVPKQLGIFLPPNSGGVGPAGGVVHYKLTRLKITKQ